MKNDFSHAFTDKTIFLNNEKEIESYFNTHFKGPNFSKTFNLDFKYFDIFKTDNASKIKHV